MKKINIIKYPLRNEEASTDDLFVLVKKINEIIDYLEDQKSHPSSPDTPIENKQDFWEAIEIIKRLETLSCNNWGYDGYIQSHRDKEELEAKYQRLLSILSSK